MAAIANIVGWRHKSRDSTPCNWNTLRYLLFCCHFRHGRRVNTLCKITERLLFFRISTKPPRHLLDHHTALVTSVVYSSASARRTAFAVPVGRTYYIPHYTTIIKWTSTQALCWPPEDARCSLCYSQSALRGLWSDCADTVGRGGGRGGRGGGAGGGTTCNLVGNAVSRLKWLI